jgi:hypothetical protein
LDVNGPVEKAADAQILPPASGSDDLSGHDDFILRGAKVALLFLRVVGIPQDIFRTITRLRVIVSLRVGKRRTRVENVDRAVHVGVNQTYELVITRFREGNRKR